MATQTQTQTETVGPHFRLPVYNGKGESLTSVTVFDDADDKACPRTYTSPKASRHDSGGSSGMESLGEEEDPSAPTAATAAIKPKQRWWRSSHPDATAAAAMPSTASSSPRFSVASRWGSLPGSRRTSTSPDNSRRPSEAPTVRRPSYVPRSAAAGFLNTTTARRVSATPQQ